MKAGEHAAQLAAKVEASTVTDDGEHMLLKLTMADGAENLIAFPRDQIPSLANLAALSISQSEAAVKAEGEPAPAFVVSWWELGVEKESGRVVLSLTFGAGGKLRFLLPHPMPAHIHETLGVMLGKSSPETPGAPLGGKLQALNVIGPKALRERFHARIARLLGRGWFFAMSGGAKTAARCPSCYGMLGRNPSSAATIASGASSCTR
jgi:hypothetical protein